MVLIGTILLIITLIIQCVGTMKEHEANRDGYNALKNDDSEDYLDAMDDGIWAETIINIAQIGLILSFILLFIGFILPQMKMVREPEPEYRPPPQQPPRKPMPPREDYGY